MLGMLRDRPRNNTSSAFAPNMAKGLVAGTRVMTLDGELPVQFLTVGDLLITRSGTKRLRAVTKREVLRTELVEIPAGRIARHGHLECHHRALVQIHLLQLESDRVEIIFADGLQIQLAPGGP